MYYLLTESFKDQHTELVKIILEAVPADKIYFLGSTLMYRRTESIFMTDAPSCRYVGHYYVLVVTGDGQSLNVSQDKIENNCQNFIPVTTIVLRTDQFNQWVNEGHQFAQTVCRIAVLLHGENQSNSSTTIETLNKEDKVEIFNQGLNKVTEFLAGADLFRIRKQNKMSAFMLHQAAEHALHTILKITTGLYFNTHNLDKLIRYCSMVSYNIADIFSRNNEKNERLFQLIQKAYIGSRYDKDYSIGTEELVIITDRIMTLKNKMKDYL